MIEVELKAHVDDPVTLRSRIEELRGISSAAIIDTSDTYFHLPGTSIDESLFRLRIQEEKGIVTRKHRKRIGAMEINDEIEYEVSDPEAFMNFSISLGNEIYVKKEKKGFIYSLDDISIGLWEVAPLGWFIEVEVLVETAEEKLVEEAERGIYDVLKRLQIPQTAHEPRYYMEMLLEQ